MAAESEKLQKILARGGVGSRRGVEKLIEQGRVSVNGKPAKLGDRASVHDAIEVDGQRIKATRLAPQLTRVLLYNKPEGEVCTRDDEQNRPTVFAALPRIINSRWISVGRLDLNTSGLLLFTNNGELASRLMHPSQELSRVYSVRVYGKLDDAKIAQLKKGVALEDGMASFDQISRLPQQESDVANQWLKVSLKEGRNREVRRLFEAVGLQVNRLIRTRYGDMPLPRDLRQGKTRELTWKQVNELLASVSLPPDPRPDKANLPQSDATRKRLKSHPGKQSGARKGSKRR
jgi:23S rRNA pseudouridine2605 synthase